MNAINSKPSSQSSGEIPMDHKNVLKKEALELLSPWGLSEEDLEMFRAQPEGRKWAMTNPKRSNFKSAVEVLESLQGCYDLTLARDREKELMDGYSGNAHPLHIRRTLDQSHYYMLDNTRSQNRDQVVSRYGERHQAAQQHQPVVIMVDQLWLWMVEGNARTIRPLTLFKNLRTYLIGRYNYNILSTEDGYRTGDPDSSGLTDVFQSILRNSSRVKTMEELVTLIVNECSGACFNTAKFLDEKLQFLDIFERSIGIVVSIPIRIKISH